MRPIHLAAALALALALAACDKSAPPAPAGPDGAAEAKAFLEKNKAEPGVVTTPSGLQYKIITSGPADGPKPGRTDEVMVHYEGKLLDGEIFDSSLERGMPASFAADRVIPGWTEVLQLMRPGDEWDVYIPPNLAYGEEGNSRIPPNSALIFRIQLLGVRQAG